MSTPLIETKHLKKYFDTPRGKLHAVDDISITIERGKTLGIVGESGCGKTTLGRVLLRLIPATSGQVFYDGEDILTYNRHQMNEMRKKMQIIFQDPFSSLNPRLSVTNLIAEPMKVCKTVRTRAELQERVKELMKTVGLAERLVNAYPHELDGGRRQRIGIARARGEPEAHRLRRADLRAGRVHSGADFEPAQAAAKGHGPYLHLHHARFVRRQVFLG